MALPNQIDKTAPANTGDPSAGAADIRNLKIFLEDLLGLTDATNYTVAPVSISTAGVISFAVTPLVDHISEKTGAHGVEIDGVTLKDSGIVLATSTAPGTAMTIYENGDAVCVNMGTSGLLLIDNTGATARLTLTDAGILMLGTGITTSVSAGEMVLANNKGLRASNAAGTDTLMVIKLDNADLIEIGGNANYPVLLAGGTSVAGAAGLNGGIAVDTGNNWFTYYSNGARYKVTGTIY